MNLSPFFSILKAHRLWATFDANEGLVVRKYLQDSQEGDYYQKTIPEEALQTVDKFRLEISKFLREVFVTATELAEDTANSCGA